MTQRAPERLITPPFFKPSLLINLPLSLCQRSPFCPQHLLLFFTCFKAALLALLLFLRSFPFLCFDNTKPTFFNVNFHRTLMNLKLFPSISLKTYIQHFTEGNKYNILLRIGLKSFYLFIVRWSTTLFYSLNYMMHLKIYVETSAASPSSQKLSA